MTRENHKIDQHKFSFIMLCVAGGYCLHVCLGTICVLSALRGQKRVTESLELEFKAVVSHQSNGIRKEAIALN